MRLLDRADGNDSPVIQYAPRRVFGYDDITAESVGWFVGNAFERLCHEMLWFEVGERHPGGTVGGKPREYVGDRGIDLVVQRVGAPLVAGPDYREPLTFDDAPQRECVNCKSGHSWKDKLLENAYTQAAPLDFVAAGDRFTAFVHVEVGAVEKEQLEIHLANILGGRMDGLTTAAIKKRLKNEAKAGLTKEQKSKGDQNLLPGAASEVRPRVRVRCANDIWQFLRRHRPPLSSGMRYVMRLREPKYLLEYGAWDKRHAVERMKTTIVYDEARARSRDALLDVINSSGVRIVWVHGPPGIGKTRLALEAIALAGCEVRTVYAPSLQAAQAEMHIVSEFSGVVLVVDDVPPVSVSSLVVDFRSRATEQQRPVLVALGSPRRVDFEKPDRVSEVPVERLDDAAIREMLQGDLTADPSDEEIDRMLSLSKGSPWFCLLLARAIYGFPGRARVPATPWEAALLALAGRPSLSSEAEYAWESRAVAHAKSLIPVLVFSGLSLNAVERKYGVELLSEVFSEDWQVLRKAIERCHQLGIVRLDEESLSYVSPGVLAQIVATRLLRPSGGMGAAIAKAFPDELGSFRDRLVELHVSSTIVDAVAN